MADPLTTALGKIMGDKAVVGQTSEYTPPSSIPVFTPDPELARIQAETDALRAQTASLQAPAATFAATPAAAMMAAAPSVAQTVYDASKANQAAKSAYDAMMATWKPMISTEEWNKKSNDYQLAAWDYAVKNGGGYAVPGRNASGPQVDIFTPPPSQLQAQASRAGRRDFLQGMGVTSRAQLRAMAPAEKQALKQQYEAPQTPTSPYWQK